MSAHQLTTDLPVPRIIRTLAVLGDSTCVGVGDPRIGGGWRGFPPLLADALGADLVNVARNGARLGCLRREQLPLAASARPDAVVVFAGMNDTLRSDFDTGRLHADLDEVVSTLTGIGALVVTVRYHDHSRVFRLPGPLRRALTQRIAALNGVVDDVARRYRSEVVDLHELPETYQPTVWSVDRLHPSERGHRMLARAFAESLATVGAVVPDEVSLDCADSATISQLQRVAWLVCKGIPWLWRRGQDLVPYALGVLLDAALHLPTRTRRPVVGVSSDLSSTGRSIHS